MSSVVLANIEGGATLAAIYAVSFLLAVFIIVFLHEMGHFLVGRWCGVKVEAFSIGFGPEIWGFTDRHGTRWKLSWIPLGGYVRFAGDANAASLPAATEAAPGTLQGAVIWKRMLIVLAGPFANFLSAVFIFAAGFWLVGQFVLSPKVNQVVAGGAAEQAGVLAGDVVLAVDGTRVKSFGDIQDYMLLHGAESIVLTIDRSGQEMVLTITPKIVQVDDGMGGKRSAAQIGIGADPNGQVVKYPLGQSLVMGAQETQLIITNSLRAMWQMLTGTRDLSQAHGTIGVAKMAGDTMMMGPWYFVTLIGFISVSIGLVNLFPIPMLDGGHLLFYVIEAIKGRPVNIAAQEWSFRIGLAVILVFVLLVARNDLRIFGI